MRIAGLVLTALLTSTCVAAAADIASEAPPEVSADIDQSRFGWTGFYVGGSGGYGWLEDVDYAPPPGFPNPLYDQGEDWVVGAHAGYLHQFGNFVAGAEAEAMRLDITYEGFNFITINNAFALKGRGGIAWDRFLFTGHFGGVYATTNFNGLKDWGWNAGVGVDYAVTNNIIVGGQYTYYDFTEFDGTQIDANIDLLTARVAYKF